MKYTEETKQGYKVMWTFYDEVGGNNYTIINRGVDYTVCWKYDEETGTWAQGHYGFTDYFEAVRWIANESNIKWIVDELQAMDTLIRNSIGCEEYDEVWNAYGIPDGTETREDFLEYTSDYKGIKETFKKLMKQAIIEGDF